MAAQCERWAREVNARYHAAAGRETSDVIDCTSVKDGSPKWSGWQNEEMGWSCVGETRELELELERRIRSSRRRRSRGD